MGRISIAGMLGFVAVFAIGFAALVNATAVWVGVAFTLTIGVLLASVLAAILRGWRRGGWLGFALFGWGYLLLGNVSALGLVVYASTLPDVASEWVFSKSNSRPVPPAAFLNNVAGSRPMTPEDFAYYLANDAYNNRSGNATIIGRWLSVLLFAEVGAILGVLLARGRRVGEATPAAADRPGAAGHSTTVPHVP
jgi:hypothetical protein